MSDTATTVNLGTTGMLSSRGGAAVALWRKGTGHRFLAGLWRVLAGWPNASHRRPYSPPYYLERARMSREIDRL
ncbi:MAG TPA: hypothetical protein VMS92_13255 [Mycobacterium sp.]|nr:hypothetical protein [Mycobacterium sp.]